MTIGRVSHRLTIKVDAMSHRAAIQAILNHPVNRNRKISTMFRIFSWYSRKYFFPRASFILSTRAGFKVRLHPDSGEAASLVLYDQSQDMNELAFLQRYLRKGDWFVDCGANIGVYSLFARELIGEAGKIWSFEPNGVNFARLNENVALNGYKNVATIQKAVTRAPGIVAFTVALDTGNAIAKYRLSGDIERGVEEVPATDLESALPDGQFAMWKLDIEGAELDALKGATGLLSRGNPPVLQLELSSRRLKRQGSSFEEVERFLSDLGYDLYLYQADRNDFRRFAGEARQPGIVGDALAIFREAMPFVRERIGPVLDP